MASSLLEGFMPQPISRVLSDAELIIGARSVGTRPELAVLVAEAIGIWSEVESRLGSILAFMLTANAVAVSAMYNELSAQAQRAILLAAARSTLSADDNLLFRAVVKQVTSSAKDRHKLAHWLWGWSPQLPDALLLCDPAYMRDYIAFAEENKELEAKNRYPRFDWDHTFVYRKADFDAIISTMMKVFSYVDCLRAVVDPAHFAGERARLQLLSVPLIHQEIDRLQRGSKTDPAVHPPSPEPDDHDGS